MYTILMNHENQHLKGNKIYCNKSTGLVLQKCFMTKNAVMSLFIITLI